MTGGAALDVQDRLFRALAVLRWVLLANTIGQTVLRWDNFEHQHAAVVVLLVATVWTGVVLWLCADHRRRRTWVLLLDLALAVASLLLTPLVKGPDFRATLLGFWIAGPLLACAIRWRTAGGLGAGLLLGVVDLAIRSEISQSAYGNVFLLVVGGAVVGRMSGSIQEMAVQRAAAEQEAAAERERARLARAVHDGVLQVLALVQRRGAEHGGELAEVGRLAGQQEAALRSLIRSQDVGRETQPETAWQDLTLALEGFSSGHVTVATPGVPVLVPGAVAAELTAAVGEAVANVARHVGDRAPVWLLLDDDGNEIVVSVRDEGPGIAAGRLDRAAAAGRMGVSESIRGRLTALGGTARVDTGAYGTEWELRLPRSVLGPAAEGKRVSR